MKALKLFFVLVSVLIMIGLITGCSKDVSKASAVDVLSKPGAKVEVVENNCVSGEEWLGFDFEREGLEPGTMFIKGVETSGEYKGLCHVKYKGSIDSIDFWFSQDRSSGYYKVGDFVREWKR